MNDSIGALVRRHDPDRFLTALFAPPEKREALLTLYAFNHELARAREVTSEPTLALIRLQWWREVVEGQAKRHEVARPLSEAIGRGALRAEDLLAIIDARETEAEPAIETVDAWRAWLLAGAGGLTVAAGRLLGAPDPEALRPFGAAFAVAGLLRGARILAAQGRCLLPADVLATHGLSPEAVTADPDTDRLQDAGRAVAREGMAFLAAGGRVHGARPWIAAILPAVLARRDLRRWPRINHVRGLGDRLAVTLCGLTGRI
ncbi:MAG: squalene/phytoene synthase family protein [Acetobacteraceae bacterium]